MSAPTSTADIVNSWFRDTCTNGPVARDTEAYNQVVRGLPDLIARLDGQPSPAPADSSADNPDA